MRGRIMYTCKRMTYAILSHCVLRKWPRTQGRWRMWPRWYWQRKTHPFHKRRTLESGSWRNIFSLLVCCGCRPSNRKPCSILHAFVEHGFGYGIKCTLKQSIHTPRGGRSESNSDGFDRAEHPTTNVSMMAVAVKIPHICLRPRKYGVSVYS